jgi:hypothetical protein
MLDKKNRALTHMLSALTHICDLWSHNIPEKELFFRGMDHRTHYRSKTGPLSQIWVKKRTGLNLRGL